MLISFMVILRQLHNMWQVGPLCTPTVHSHCALPPTNPYIGYKPFYNPPPHSHIGCIQSSFPKLPNHHHLLFQIALKMDLKARGLKSNGNYFRFWTFRSFYNRLETWHSSVFHLHFPKGSQSLLAFDTQLYLLFCLELVYAVYITVLKPDLKSLIHLPCSQ
jgi:hypothetical protein